MHVVVFLEVLFTFSGIFKSFVYLKKAFFFYISVFKGRGQKSHAYTHSVQEGHHVFLNLETKKFYCLPDNYQIIDQSLEDIVVSVF